MKWVPGNAHTFYLPGSLQDVPLESFTMWSRNFLRLGLATGFLAATLALGGIWLVLFALFGRSEESARGAATILIFCLPGLFVYPLCWYLTIVRERAYSRWRTTELVVATFFIVWLLVAVLMMLGGAYTAIPLAFKAASAGKIAASFIVALAPLALGMVTVTGAIILFIPFMLVATPMAFFHRWLLLKLFSSTAPSA
jgi:hypothetical protein